ERRTAPEGEPFAQRRRALGRLELLARREQVLELTRVDLVARVDVQDIAGRPPFDALVTQRLAQAEDGVLHRGCRGLRRPLAPDPVDQLVLRDDMVRPQEEHGENRSLPWTAERHHAGLRARLERAQESELHGSATVTGSRAREKALLADWERYRFD